MAIYHFSAQVLGRGAGRKNLDGTRRKVADNAVAAAAYRAGEKLRDAGNEQTHDYSRRSGVAHAEIHVPDGAPMWLADREKLWNEVERLESRKDAQLAREINIALPHELSREERLDLVRGFVREQFVAEGMVADIAWHDPVPARGDDPRNFHAHIMLTLRQATGAGLHEVKTRAWNSREAMKAWRAAWQGHANRALERAGKTVRIDHRTLKAQRTDAQQRGDRQAALVLDRTPEIHLGPRAKAMVRRQVAPVSRVRPRGAPRRADRVWWAAAQQEAPRAADPRPVPRESYEQYRRERAMEREREREAFAEERMARARERWARRAAWEERQREWRQRQDLAEHRRKQKAVRRLQDYRETDYGPRVGWLWDKLTGNNQQAKLHIARLEQRAARFDRWLDYYDRKITWLAEGKIRGGKFRYERMLASRAEREQRAEAERKAAHAAKRKENLTKLARELRQAIAGLTFQQEKALGRRREVEGWVRTDGRVDIRVPEMTRERTRERPQGWFEKGG